MIEKLLERGGNLVESADVCVIGSGGGGAVMAAELAEAGRSVVVLEQGHYWTSRDFTQREDEMLPRLFEDGGMRQTDDGTLLILQGRNIGGSTVHNLCYCFRTPDPVLQMWRDEHGLALLKTEELDAAFARVEKNLRVKPILEREVNLLNRRIRSGADKLGYSGFVTKHNREGCVQSGYCILGCSYDAKQSMLVTYIPRADAAGARIYANARVEQIEVDGGRARRVFGHVVDHAGQPLGTIEVSARAVVVSAGAINTPDLLQRSDISDSAHLGRNLHTHPSVMVAGFFEDEIHAYRGIPQSYYIDEFLDLETNPHEGYVLMPIAGFPVLTAVNLPGFGRDHYAQMRDFSRMGGLLVLLHDRSGGSVDSGSTPGRPRIRYELGDSDRRLLARGVRHCAEVLFAAGAARCVVPTLPDALTLGSPAELDAIPDELGSGDVVLASTHPQSTCRMGGDPRSSVVNPFGECHDVPGLFVADMSVFPTSLGAPPQITTAALADRTARHLLSRWHEFAA